MATPTIDDPARVEREMVEILELTEELIALKLALGLKMKEGHFDIAAARYSRPHMGIGQAQYDLNMTAQTALVVTRACASDDDARDAGKTETSGNDQNGRAEGLELLPWHRFEVLNTSSDVSATGVDRDTTLKGSREDGMRRRATGGRVNGGGEASSGAVCATDGCGREETSSGNERSTGNKRDEETKKVRRRVPLDWFGVMVPLQLRRAEKTFKTAIDLVARIATVSSRLRALTAGDEPGTDGEDCGRMPRSRLELPPGH